MLWNVVPTSKRFAQVSEEENIAQCNVPTLRRMMKTLKEKLDIILKLDAEILEAAKEEERLKQQTSIKRRLN